MLEVVLAWDLEGHLSFVVGPCVPALVVLELVGLRALSLVLFEWELVDLHASGVGLWCAAVLLEAVHLLVGLALAAVDGLAWGLGCSRQMGVVEVVASDHQSPLVGIDHVHVDSRDHDLPEVVVSDHQSPLEEIGLSARPVTDCPYNQALACFVLVVERRGI